MRKNLKIVLTALTFLGLSTSLMANWGESILARENSTTFEGYGIVTGSRTLLAPKECYTSKIDGRKTPVGIIGDGLELREMESYLQAGRSQGKPTAKYGKIFEAYHGSLLSNTTIHQYHYAWLLGNQTHLRLDGFGQDLLNREGKHIYNNEPDDFDAKCGDYILHKYLNGSMITASLDINFENAQDSERYRILTRGDSKLLGSRVTKLQTLMDEHQFPGAVTIQAVQIGGTPDELASTGMQKHDDSYYALTCDLENMQSCVDATMGYYDYVRNNYPNQLSTRTEKGLVPLLAEQGSLPKYYYGL